MRTVLYPPTLDWDFLFQRPQQLMRQFARHGWRVLFCNVTQIPGAPPSTPEPNLEVHHDWAGLLAEHPSVDVLWTSWAVYHNLYLDAKLVVFDYLDEFEDWRPFFHPMLFRADVVFAASAYLQEKVHSAGRHALLVRNGCDPDHIGSDASLPPDLAEIPRPVVGFVGAVAWWVDRHLLEAVAKRYSTVVIGPPYGNDVAGNCINLGVRAYSELPRYYNNLDVGLIPFGDFEVAKAANPIKMYEYLAAGKPVVATATAETSLYPEFVLTATDTDGFLNQIERALSLPDAEARRAFARQHSWAARFAQIEPVLLAHLGG